MMNLVNVKIGQMPGLLNEYALEVGTTVGQALEIAGLDATGYELKLDGATVSTSTQIGDYNKLLVLVKQIKGNMNTVKIGQMPGLLNEYTLEPNTTVRQALEIAGLDSNGYEIKLDGVTVSQDTVLTSSSRLLVLVKQIKGNAQVLKVGTMPGLLKEMVFEPHMTVKQVLDMAELNPSGYEIKLDGSTVTQETVIPTTANLLILVKQIKGNK